MNLLYHRRGSLPRWPAAALVATPVLAVPAIISSLRPAPAVETPPAAQVFPVTQTPKTSTGKPNVIFVLADDMGYGDLNCYGGIGAQTPNIDRLAAEGLRFTQFYVNSPICSPSRTAFTTGQYPARWRITSFIDNRAANSRRGMAQWLDTKAPTLARSLAGAGYRTGHFGKWHMGGGRDVGEAPLPIEYGFSASLTQFEGLGDRVLPYLKGPDGNREQKMGLAVASEKLGRGQTLWTARSQVTKTFVDRSLEFIKEAEKGGQPFYINLWPDDVHSPYDPPPALRGNGSKKALYRGVLTNMDAQLGPLFDYVRNNPRLRDNTIIVFASDNGPERGSGSSGGFRGRKGNLYEGGIREPFIVWAPGLMAAKACGTVNKNAVFSAVDFLPSVLGLAGIKTNSNSDGENIGATLLGKSTTGRKQPIFWRRPPGQAEGGDGRWPDLAVREGNWKLLLQVDGTQPELYNLADDSREVRNVAAQHPALTQRLKTAVLAWNANLPVDAVTPPATKTQFALTQGQHLNREQAPAIANRGFTISARFDAQAPNGVIVAQGGVAQGYTLFLDEQGKLTFLLRVDGVATTVATPSPISGRHKVQARLGQDRSLTLILDDKIIATGHAASLIPSLPLDGLDVGSDEAGLVGPYKTASPFQGKIESVTIELTAR